MAPLHLHRWLLAAAAALSSLSTVSATDAAVRWMPNLPEWQAKALMRLQLTAPSAEAAGLTYDVYPLASLLANGTQVARSTVKITGNIAIAEPETYDLINRTDSIAYVSCDREDANQIVNDVLTMRANLNAILLYSLKGDCCGLQGTDVPFDSIYTMGNAGEALDALNITTSTEGVVRASILGNWTMERGEEEQAQGGSNSAVAMSILYSITGIITLLFLVIIATGAIRARRYPERYGPRSGYGGRPRQSRAKGLARAVLETLPIVKFGESAPAKPDPALELESQTSSHSPDPSARARLSAIPEEPRTPMVQLGNSTPKPEPIPEAVAVTAAPLSAIGSGIRHGPNDEHLGCSICTEDFTVGEDVRVLPCDHRFHPPCIDPWLINVSGTCPLCRLDLRPEKTVEDGPDAQLPPPLAVDLNEHDDASGPSRDRRRTSRILDLHRLRHASVEERIEILRRHRTQQQEQATEPDPEERGRRARLADRLRDKFRVRTRTQSPPQAARAGRTTPPGNNTS